MSQEDQPQTIHPGILPRLDPEYAEFHNKYIAPVVPFHKLPWSPDFRSVPPGNTESPIAKVGSVRDILLENCSIRVHTPEGVPPSQGWPVYVFIHGGGWTFGSLSSQTSYVARQTKENNCITICLDHRLAPENPYPVAIIDTIDALKWIHQNGKRELNANVNKIAVGGVSSGGNLAAVVALKAQQLNPPIPIIFQVLVVPVVDNTASESGDVYPSWKELKDTVWLNADRMMWFRHNYLPDPETWSNWDNSPIFAPESLLANAPPAWIGVCEMDILKDEGIAYGEKLRSLGVEVEIKVYEGVPHQIIGLDGVLAKAKVVVAEATKALGDAFKNTEGGLHPNI